MVLLACEAGMFGSDRRDLPLRDGDVAHRRDVVLGIDDMAALEQEVVPGLRHGAGNDE